MWIVSEHVFSQTFWEFRRGLTYFAISAQHPLLAGQPHSTMSCECQLVSYVHCPQCKVICHCIALALQKNVSKWHSSSTIITTTKVHPSHCFFGAALLDGRAAVTLTGSSAEIHSHRLRLALTSSQTPLWGKLIWIILHVYTHGYDIRIRSWTSASVWVCVWVIERVQNLLLRLSMLLCETGAVTLCQKAAASIHNVSSSNTKAYGEKHILLFWHFSTLLLSPFHRIVVRTHILIAATHTSFNVM